METSERLVSTDTEGDNTVARRIHQAESGAHHTIDKAAAGARPAVDRVAASAHHAVDGAANVANRAAGSLRHKGERLKEARGHVMEYSREHLSKHPVASLSIAVCAGFLLGRMIGSR